MAIRPWLYVQTGVTGHKVPILLLDTDLDQNSAIDRTLTHHLYGGDAAYRLKQEIILGIGGARVLRALGFNIEKWHMNEGHAALLTLDRLAEARAATGGDGLAEARKQCVFTTHTPVPAGQDRFPYDLYAADGARAGAARHRQGACRPGRTQHDAAGAQPLRLFQRGGRAACGDQRATCSPATRSTPSPTASTR